MIAVRQSVRDYINNDMYGTDLGCELGRYRKNSKLVTSKYGA